ncbi:MAG: hypothetical protein ABR527_05890, partial [Gemmatimonadota bacterium]
MNEPRNQQGGVATATAHERKGAGDVEQQAGTVVQVIGPVIDVEFVSEELPEIYTALRLDHEPEEGDERGVGVHLT